MKKLLFCFLFICWTAFPRTYPKGPALIEVPEVTTSSAGDELLTKDSYTNQVLIGGTTHTYTLPDATTIPTGRRFVFRNDSTGALTIEFDDDTTLATVPAGKTRVAYLRDNGTSNGTWSVTPDYVLRSGDTMTGQLHVDGVSNGLKASLDDNAGDSTNSVSVQIGNANASQGSLFMQYFNDVATGSPRGRMSFQPRTNADDGQVNSANITIQKDAAADTATIQIGANSTTFTSDSAHSTLLATMNSSGLTMNSLPVFADRFQMSDDGTFGTPSLNFSSDTALGLYSPATNQIGITADEIQLEDGTQADPVLQFRNDTDTGIYRSGVNTMVLVTNGANQITVDGSGNTDVQGSVTADGVTIDPVGASPGDAGQVTMFELAANGTNNITIRANDNMTGTFEWALPPAQCADDDILQFDLASTTWECAAAGSGAGDVTGPGSSTDNAIARFDGATGKIIQNSGWTINDSNGMSVTGGSLSIQQTPSATPLSIEGDAGAGDSTNDLSVKIGNQGSEGSMFLQYFNAAAASTPSFRLSFQPRNNGDTAPLNMANFEFKKDAAADTATVTLGTNQFNFSEAASGTPVRVRMVAQGVQVRDGGPTTPSIAFISDTNTGIYRVGTDNLGIVTGGTDALTIDSTQDVGIGDTSPDSRLEVSYTGSNGGITVTGGTGVDTTPGDGTATASIQKNGTSGETAIMSYSSGGNNTMSFYTNAGGAAAEEQMEIGSGGLVTFHKDVRCTVTTVNLTADNTAIDTTDECIIELNSNSGTATDRTFTLTNVTAGKFLYITTSAGAAEIANGGTVRLPSASTVTFNGANDFLTLVGDSGASFYRAISFSDN